MAAGVVAVPLLVVVDEDDDASVGVGVCARFAAGGSLVSLLLFNDGADADDDVDVVC